MSDVTTFIDALGTDVSATVLPKIEGLAGEISKQSFEQYGPRVSAFAGQLVKDIIDEQVGTVRNLAAGLMKDLFERYSPELGGELHARIVQGGIEVLGSGVRLDVKLRKTGASVASLDIPVALTIKVDPLSITLRDSTVRLDVI